MTESEWLDAVDPDKMLTQVLKGKRKLGVRKLRLFCVGCCRQIVDAMEEVCRRAVEMAERFADGDATAEELAAAREAGMRRNRRRFDIWGFIRAQHSPEKMQQHGLARWCWEATEATTRPGKPIPGKVILAVGYMQFASQVRGGLTDLPALAAVLRDVAGNPFRPVPFAASWQTANAVALAQSIYQQRAFERMPILADALEDAGCTEAAVLEHCRGPGPHVRGCWVVDQVLGKE